MELLVSMVEMTYGSQYKYEDHTTAIVFIDAKLEKINSHASFARAGLARNDSNPGCCTC